MADDTFDDGDGDSGGRLSRTLDGLDRRTRSLTAGANGFASAMSRAFIQATVGGKQLDEVLKGLALRLSTMALNQAFRPIASGLMSGINGLFENIFRGNGSGLASGRAMGEIPAFAAGGSVQAAMGAIKPFAAGGVIGTPTYFPMLQGGVGLAGEAGPEAILPLSRGPDGRLGVATGGQGGASVTIHIATPDAESFRRSETYITGQIARAVARGQRSL